MNGYNKGLIFGLTLISVAVRQSKNLLLHCDLEDVWDRGNVIRKSRTKRLLDKIPHFS